MDRQRRHEPGRRLVHAEHRVAEHDEPVEQRRLVEVRLALEVRHDPVAASEHLARDLRVAALVRLEQVERQRRVKEQGGKNDEEK